MNTELAVRPVMDIAAHKDAINAIQRLLSEVMIKGTHYGPVPGCGNKPVLLKPGAEKVMATFGIRPRVRVTETAEDYGNRRFQVVVEAYSHSGDFLGEGIGEASTAEEKFAWENAKCDEHWDTTPESMRRIRWRTRDGHAFQDKQVRTSPSDKANTALKIAKKRALVDMVLTVTAASDIFEQDLDEEHLRPSDVQDAPEPVKPPQRKAAPKSKAPPQGDQFYGTVTKVTTKEGEGKNGPWTKYGIQLDGKEWFNTFDHDIGVFAQDREGKGQVLIASKDDKYGKVALGISDYEPGAAGEQDDIPF